MQECFNILRVWSWTGTSTGDPLVRGFHLKREPLLGGFIHCLIHKKTAAERSWQHQSKSIFFIEMTHSSSWLTVSIVKSGLDWNNCAQNVTNAPRGAAARRVSDSLIFFFPSRKWSRQSFDKWKGRNSKWAFFSSPFGSNCHTLCGCFQTCGSLFDHSQKKL